MSSSLENLLAGWADTSGAQRLGAALVHFVWQGAALALLAWMLLIVLRRARPQTRYAVLLAVFVGMAASPAITFLLVDAEPRSQDAGKIAVLRDHGQPRERMMLAGELDAAFTMEPAADERPAPRHASAPEEFASAGAPPSVSNTDAPYRPDVTDVRATRSWTDRWQLAAGWVNQHYHWIVTGWLAGVCLLSLRLVAGLIGAERARRRGVTPAADAIGQLAERLAHRLGIRHAVRVMESTLAEVPTLVGWLRPVILLPACAVSGLTASQLEAILAHELAHVRRHDALVNLWQTVVETILFYHPAVWWVSQKIRHEREHCCDDVVVALCHDRLGYARALAAMEALRPLPAGWSLAARGGSLMERIRRVVERPEPVGNGKPALVAIAAVLFALVVCLSNLSKTPSAADAGEVAAAGAEQGTTLVPEAPAAPDYPDLKRIEREIGVVPFQHDHDITNVGWLDEGRSLFTTSRHGLRVWDLATKNVTRELARVGENDFAASIDRAGRRIVVAGDFAKPQLWEWPSRKMLREFDVQGGRGLALSPDGTKVAVATRDSDNHGNLRVFDADTGALLFDRRGPPTLALAWSPDSTLLAAGESRGIVIFLRPDGTLVRRGITLEDAEPPLALAFDEPGERLAVLTVAGSCGVWKMQGRQKLWSWKSRFANQNILQDRAFGGLLFAAGDQKLFAQSSRTSMVFDAPTGEVLHNFGDDFYGLANLALSPDGKTLIRQNSPYRLDLVDVATFQSILPRNESHPEPTREIRLSADGGTLLALGQRRIDFWSSATFGHLGGADLRGYCDDACFSPDGQLAAVVRHRRGQLPAAVELLEVPSGIVRRTFPLEEHSARGVAFTPDGKHVAAGEIHYLSLWDVESGAQNWRVKVGGEKDWLEQLAISPDGRRLAAILMFRETRGGGANPKVEPSDGEIRLFRTETGEELGELATAGTPERIQFIRGATLLAAMSSRHHSNREFPVLVEWDTLRRELRPERSIVLPDGPSTSLLSFDAEQQRLLIALPYTSTLLLNIAVWDADRTHELRRLTFPTQTKDARLLPGNRMAVVKRNGNLLVLNLDDAPPQGAGKNADGEEAKQDAKSDRTTEAAGDQKKAGESSGEKAPAAWAVSGRVVDVDEKPIAGARVVAVDRRIPDVETTTNAEGEFRLSLPADASSVKLTVTDAPGTRLWVDRAARAPSGKSERKVVLAPAREVAVEVVDAQGGPIEGATVLSRQRYLDVELLKTDRRGTARLRLPGNSASSIGAGPTFIIAFKSGAGYDYFSTDHRDESNYPKGPVEIPPQLKLSLTGARTVRVQAIDTAGQPVPGVSFGPWYVNRVGNPGDMNFAGTDVFRSQADERGVATFDWLPLDFKRGVTFRCDAGGFATPDPLTVQADDPGSDFQLRLLRQTVLAGRVLLPDGRPAAGISVQARGAGVTFHGGHGLARTGADGRFKMSVAPDQAYIVSAERENLIVSRIGVIVREKQPVEDVELKLAEGTILTGQITRGPEKKPVAGQHVQLQLEGGAVPEPIEKLRRPGDNTWHAMTLTWGQSSDAEGRFRFIVGPGNYALFGPRHAEPAQFKVADEKVVVRDFHLPREDEVPFNGLVVDTSGKPVPQAAVVGYYATARIKRFMFTSETDAQGRFQIQRETQPLVIHVISKDRALALVARSEQDETERRFELQPTATARGRLLDVAGAPIPGGVVGYTVRVHQGGKDDPWMDAFGGEARAGEDGKYELPHLARGADWFVDHERWELKRFRIEEPGDVDLGDTKRRPEPKPYVPPTLEQQVTTQFRLERPLVDRIVSSKAEAKREYLRIMLVLADPESETAKQLFTIINDRNDKKIARANNDYQALWVKATSAIEGIRVARDMSLDLGRPAVPSVSILNDDGTLRETLALADGPDGKPDADAVRGLLVRHMLPERDGRQALADALSKAEREGKRVFVQETATWCGPCRMLSRFIDRHREIFDANFVWLKLDRERHTEGEAVMKKLRGDRQGGIPWVVILDAAGKELGTSDDPDGENYGFPTEPDEIKHFMKLVKSTAPRLTEEQATTLQKALEGK